MAKRRERARPVDRRPHEDARAALVRSLRLVLLVWIELVAVQSAWPGCAGVATSFAGAGCLILLDGRIPARPTRCVRRAFACAALVALGVSIHPWLGLVSLQLFVRLGGTIPGGAPFEPCGFEVVAALLVAPLFEEALYRGRLLVALRPYVGTPLAIVGAGAAFALPHIEPLRVIGCFVAGLALGSLFALCGRTWPCMALHVGLNVAALAWPRSLSGHP